MMSRCFIWFTIGGLWVR